MTSKRPKKILIFGGTGFLGYNFLQQAPKQSHITIVSRTQPKFPLARHHQYVSGDITDFNFVRQQVIDQDIILNFAGAGPIDSLINPIKDLKTTSLGALNILEACRLQHSPAKIIFIGSRLEIGKADQLPVSETTLPQPETFYGIHKLSVTHYARLYRKLYRLNTFSLRFPGIYGPHQLPGPKNHNIVNQFIDQAIANKPLTIFGKGQQLRDYLFITDALSAINLTVSSTHYGQLFSFGTTQPVSLHTLAQQIISLTGAGFLEYKRWPKKLHQIETGDFYSDSSLAKEILGWSPRTSLKLGLTKTIKAQRSSS